MKLTELLTELGVSFVEEGDHEHARQGWVNIDCPFCSPGWQHFRLGINEDFHNTNCWTCGPKGLINSLSQITNRPWKELQEAVTQLDREGGLDKLIPKKPRGVLKLPTNQKLSIKQKHYLTKRGFNVKELVRLWDIRGISWHRRYGWRILIPIYYRGQIVSFTTRSTQRSGQRYLSASSEEESVSHKSLLYGEDYARQAVIVVEGPTDVWRVGPGAVATFGTGFNNHQLLRLVRYAVRGVCFDSGTVAQGKADKLCEALAPFPGQTMRIELSSDDPGSCSPEEIAELRAKVLGEKK